MGIFGFRSQKKDESPRDDAFDASVAAVKVDPPAEAEEPAGKRAVTAEQRERFEVLLVEHRLDHALVVALAYAKKRTGSVHMAKQYVSRARGRMWENCSWDPQKGPTLSVFLCGIVRSEMSSDAEKDERREETEQSSLSDPSTSPQEAADPEAVLLAAEEKQEDDRDAGESHAWLRAEFESNEDAVNLCWLKLRSEGVEDEAAAMADRSEFTADDYYNARKRRMRAVGRLLALKEKG